MREGPPTLRICRHGHRYYKSSKCPVCPECESDRKNPEYFAKNLAAPARRALEAKGITHLHQLTSFCETEIFQLHGMGKSAMAIIIGMMRDSELAFKQNEP